MTEKVVYFLCCPFFRRSNCIWGNMNATGGCKECAAKGNEDNWHILEDPFLKQCQIYI